MTQHYVPFRCSARLLDKIDEIRHQKGFKNRAEVLRFIIDDYEPERHAQDEYIRFIKRLEGNLTNRNSKSEIVEERLNEILEILIATSNLNPRARKILAEQMPQYFQNT